MVKKNKGITIITLIIIIIILLILSGVTISSLTGNNGIITKAIEAKDSTRGAEVKEYVELAVLENETTNKSNKKSKKEVIEELIDAGKITEQEKNLLEENNIIKIGNVEIDFSSLELKLVDMYQKALKDNCSNEDGLCTNEEHLHIGDYVGYKNPTEGTYTVDAGVLGVNYKQTYDVKLHNIKWQVLGIDSTTGGIKLVSDIPIKKNSSDGTNTDDENSYLIIRGANGYLNSINELNNICNLYSTDIGKSRSINQDDINEITGITSEDMIKKYNIEYNLYGNKNYGETIFCENNWNPKMWINSENAQDISENVTGYYYSINKPWSGNLPYVSVNNSRINKLLFEDLEYNSYWLATQSISAFYDSNNNYIEEAQYCLNINQSSNDITLSGMIGLFRSSGVELRQRWWSTTGNIFR